MISRFDIHLVRLNPTEGHEMRKRRPCLIVSPDEMHRHVRTVIIAPMTSARRPYPSRVDVTFQGKRGQIALDQLRAVDQHRLVRRVGEVDKATAQEVAAALQEMLAL